MRALTTLAVAIYFVGTALAQQPGHPPQVRVLELSGPAHERGLQHGRQLRGEIAKLVELWRNDLRSDTTGPEVLIKRFLAETDFVPAIRRWTPDLLDEVRGIAEGSGQPFDTILAFQLVDELWVYLDRPVANHCSSIGVARSGGHPALVAQNLDLEPFRNTYQVVLHIAETPSAPEQLVFTSAGLIGANGVNSRSIGIACNTLMQLSASANGLPVAFVVRGVLARSSGEEALEFLKGITHASGQNYVLGAGDRIFDFEASAGKVVEFRPTADGSVVYHTNHPLLNDDWKPWHRALADLQPTGEKRMGSSETRLASLRARLGRPAAEIDAGVIKEALRSKDSEAFPVCRPLRADAGTFTFGATIMTLSGEPSLEVTMGPPDTSPFVRLDFRGTNRSLSAAALPAPADGGAVAPAALGREQAQKLIQESEEQVAAILAKEIYLPGLAVALVSRDEVMWARAYGFRDAARTRKVDDDTLYGLLSLSKTVTVTGLMAAVDEGLLDLDVPIRTYLPELHVNSRFPQDPMATITLRHLLSMTSGLTHDAPVGNNADPYTPSYEEHIRSISRTWLRFPTGERAECSNLGIELAAYILEKVTHRPFPEYIQKKIFDPLEMTRSTYALDRIQREENRAIGQNKSFERVPLENPMLAPGGAYSSIRDMAKLLQFQIQEGKLQGRSLIRDQTLVQMRTIPFPTKDQVAGYGMGLWVGYFHLGGQDVRWLAHGGGGFGYRCQMKWLPDHGYGVVVLTNSQDHDNVNEGLADDILLKVVELLTGKKELGPADWLNRHTPTRTVDPSYLPVELAGRYNGTNDDMLFLVKDGKLGYASGTSFLPFTPISRDEYASKRYLYRFVREAAGKPVAVVRPYDGTVWTLGSAADEPTGPEKKEWTAFLGGYVRKRFGLGERFYNVTMKNGWLHFQGDGQDFRLTEHTPGLFFTPDGEAVDLRGPAFSFRNIRLYKCGG